MDKAFNSNKQKGNKWIPNLGYGKPSRDIIYAILF